MKLRSKVWCWVAIGVLCSSHAFAQQIRVMISGGFSSPYRQLIPQFEKTSGAHLQTISGPSMGTTPGAIPVRLSNGEPADVVIMVRTALDALAKQGVVVEGSQVDLAASRIGMAVKAGAARPDISTVEAFKHTLLKAHSVAFSDSASGVYISKELFTRLGIAKEMEKKSHQIPAVPVGVVVARGQAELGFQQMSELLPISGIRIVGPIPGELQKITMFSVGIVAKSNSKEAAKTLIRFLSSQNACAVIERSALDPIACSHNIQTSQKLANGGGDEH